MDPNVSMILQFPNTMSLMRAVQNQASQYNPTNTSQDDEYAAEPTETVQEVHPTAQKYRFLASCIEVNVSCVNQDSLLTGIEKYITEVRQGVFNKTAALLEIKRGCLSQTCLCSFGSS